MIRRPPIFTRTDTLFPYTTLFRSIVDRMGRSNLQRSRAFFVTAAGDDDLHAKQAAQGNGRRANAAGAAMNQHNVALYDIGPLEQIAPDREKRFGQCRRFGHRPEERRGGKECVSTCRSWEEA